MTDSNTNSVHLPSPVRHIGATNTYGFVFKGLVYTVYHKSDHGLVWRDGQVDSTISLNDLRDLWNNNKDNPLMERLWPWHNKDGSVEWLYQQEYVNRLHEKNSKNKADNPLPF